MKSWRTQRPSQGRSAHEVNTGDNFYYCGITGTADHQVAEDFTNVYSNKSLKAGLA